MQTASSRIWTQDADFISYDSNHETTSTSTYKIYITLYWKSDVPKEWHNQRRLAGIFTAW